MTSDRLEPVIVEAIFPPPKTVAVVGLSDRPGRPSTDVAGALLLGGYNVIPVNPNIDSALGIPACRTLKEIDVPVDIVDVFRRSEHVPRHAAEILAVRPKVIWLQDGVRDDALAAAARQAGILVVQDDCLARRIAALRQA